MRDRRDLARLGLATVERAAEHICPGPPTFSIEPQKSVVVAWYATSRNCPASLPFSIRKNRCPVNWKL